MKKSNSMHPDKFPSTHREHFIKKLRFIKETSSCAEPVKEVTECVSSLEIVDRRGYQLISTLAKTIHHERQLEGQMVS